MNRIARPFFVCFAGLLVAGFGGAGVAQEKHDTTGNGDFIVGPDYEIDPDLKDKGNPKGQSFELSMTLADSKAPHGSSKTASSGSSGSLVLGLMLIFRSRSITPSSSRSSNPRESRQLGGRLSSEA